MARPWLSDEEFRRKHEANRRTEKYRRDRREMIESDPRCAVCGSDFLKKYTANQLQYDHKRYWKGGRLIFGRETSEDRRRLCPDHHGKGTRTDAQIAMDRIAYRWGKAFAWGGRMTWRAIRCAARIAWRLLRLAWRFARFLTGHALPSQGMNARGAPNPSPGGQAGR
jgi:hypothetical protein